MALFPANTTEDAVPPVQEPIDAIGSHNAPYR